MPFNLLRDRNNSGNLKILVLNLIMNAIEAMSEIRGGPRELLIGSEVESGSVLVKISDSGPGLPAASLGRIFEARGAVFCMRLPIREKPIEKLGRLTPSAPKRRTRPAEPWLRDHFECGH